MLALSALPIPAVSMPVQKASVLEPEKYTVYCANDHIEVSFWDLEQMKVRNGSDVCQFPELYELLKRLEFRAEEFWGGRGGLQLLAICLARNAEENRWWTTQELGPRCLLDNWGREAATAG